MNRPAHPNSRMKKKQAGGGTGTIKERGAWDNEHAIDEGRKRGQLKLSRVNRDRALAARYGFYKYPKRRPE